jgi:hypothetical protein
MSKKAEVRELLEEALLTCAMDIEARQLLKKALLLIGKKKKS